MSSMYTLKPVETIGCYYTDIDGNPWCTFQAINHTATCSACGAAIGSGYSRGKLGSEDYFCSTHIYVEVEQPGHDQA